MDVATFGVIVADVIGEPMDLQHPPPAGSLTQINSLQLMTGGNVCNVSIALSRLGLKSAAAGLVGDDIFGRAIRERLNGEGVDTSAVFTIDNTQTSATIVAVAPGGQRNFYYSAGATKSLDAAAFRRCFPIIRQCAWLHIGYFGLLPALTPDLPGLLMEFKQNAPGTRIALDTLDPPASWELLEPILPLLDLFAPSRPEAIALTGQSDPAKIVAHFRKHMPQGLIGIKLDRDGCMLDDGGQSMTIAAYPVKVVDSTGAGDAWFAGLLTGLRQNMPLKECGKLANRVAADCCSAIGGSTGVRTFQESISRI